MISNFLLVYIRLISLFIYFYTLLIQLTDYFTIGKDKVTGIYVNYINTIIQYLNKFSFANIMSLSNENDGLILDYWYLVI